MKKAKGKPFTIQTLGNQLILVTSERHIKELDRAPPDQLSLHAFAKEVTLMSMIKSWFNTKCVSGSTPKIYHRLSMARSKKY